MPINSSPHIQDFEEQQAIEKSFNRTHTKTSPYRSA